MSLRGVGPLRLGPIVLAKPWGGGDRLRALGVDVPRDPPTGEVWLVADVGERSSLVSGGPFDGRSLAELRRDRPGELLGAATACDRFPLLVKLLEVEGALSLQVHPDAQTAARNGDGGRGKHESWLVLEAAPTAEVVLGLSRESTPDEVRALVERGDLRERLNTCRVARGQSIDLPPGTVHAVRGGALLLEVQEPVDLTYRLWDWGARGRELHLEKALACATLRPNGVTRPQEPVYGGEPGARRARISGTRAPFTFEVLDLTRAATTPVGPRPEAWVALEGRVGLVADGREVELRPGQAAIVAACAGGGAARALDESARVARAAVA